MTTNGLPIGWARRGSDDEWYVRPKPGLLRGCDSWIAPSWRDRGRLTIDPSVIVGEGEGTVVLATGSEPESLLGGDTDDDDSVDDTTERPPDIQP
ncbi:hypothetical protein ACFQFH_02010 [Halobaculum halobium]|uniref:hypothetical protein n=1 Tax=Halobaculum halobium TaxID=3032281 RepID=UPI00360EFFD8